MNAARYTWVNGRVQESVSIFDRGFMFGDGLFETIRLHKGEAPLLELHTQRLLASCQHLGIRLEREQFHADVQLALTQSLQQADSTWRLKYIITRGESDSGYSPNPHNTPTRAMQLLPYDVGLTRLLQQQGVKTRTCQWPLSEQIALAGLKHLNRLDQVQARKELLDRDCYEGMMRNQQGYYIEGTMSNFFAVAPDGELITPSLDNSGVAGVMRRLVKETLAPSIKLSCYEAEIHRMDEFKEIFITNALIGIVPVIAVDDIHYEIGSVTRQLQNQLRQLLEKN